MTCLAVVYCSLWQSAYAESADGYFHIGAIFSLSGFAAEAGRGELAAINLAAEEINRTGGIRGKRVIIQAEDNHSSQSDTASAFHKLTSSNKISVILGPN